MSPSGSFHVCVLSSSFILTLSKNGTAAKTSTYRPGLCPHSCLCRTGIRNSLFVNKPCIHCQQCFTSSSTRTCNTRQVFLSQNCSGTRIAFNFNNSALSNSKPLMWTHKCQVFAAVPALWKAWHALSQLTAVGVPLQTTASFHIDVIALLSPCLQALHWILCLAINAESLTQYTLQWCSAANFRKNAWQIENFWVFSISVLFLFARSMLHLVR